MEYPNDSCFVIRGNKRVAALALEIPTNNICYVKSNEGGEGFRNSNNLPTKRNKREIDFAIGSLVYPTS